MLQLGPRSPTRTGLVQEAVGSGSGKRDVEDNKPLLFGRATDQGLVG